MKAQKTRRNEDRKINRQKNFSVTNSFCLILLTFSASAGPLTDGPDYSRPTSLPSA